MKPVLTRIQLEVMARIGASIVGVAALIGLLGLLSSCATATSPPLNPDKLIGMDVSEYRRSCPVGFNIEDLFGLNMGECDARPKEYVEFRAGRLVRALSAEEVAQHVDVVFCNPRNLGQRCYDASRQLLAERESIKSKAAEAYAERIDYNRRAAVAAAFQAYSDGLAASQPINVNVHNIP